MALGVTILAKTQPMNKRVHYVMFTGDAEYPAGGYPLTANSCGMTQIDAVIVGQGLLPLQMGWDRANSKLIIFEQTDQSEIDTDEADGDFFFATVVGF